MEPREEARTTMDAKRRAADTAEDRNIRRFRRLARLAREIAEAARAADTVGRLELALDGVRDSDAHEPRMPRRAIR
jgi:hypothetical protein